MRQSPPDRAARAALGGGLFADLPPRELDILLEGTSEAGLPDRANLVRQHEPADAVWVLLEGTVHILVHFEGVGDVLMGSVSEPGSIVGWSALREPFEYTDTARCDGPVRALRVSPDVIDALCERDPGLGAIVLRRIAAAIDARLRGALERLNAPPTGPATADVD